MLFLKTSDFNLMNCNIP